MSAIAQSSSSKMPRRLNSVGATIRRKYNFQAEDYGAPIDRYTYHRWAWEKVSGKALHLLQDALKSLDQEALLLDAGCGNGRWSQLYASKGFRLIGVDFAPMMLKVAIQRARLQGYGDRFLCLLGDLENLSMIKSDSFDGVHLYGVIEHLENPSRVLEQLSRVLRPNGVLLLDCPLIYGLSHITLRLFGSHPFYRFHSLNYVEQIIDGMDCLEIEQKKPTVYIWTGGVANWLLTHVLEKANVSCIDALDSLVQVAYRRPCGMLYLIRKTR